MMDRILELYNQLTPIQKVHLDDFEIIHAIYSKKNDFSKEEVSRLYDIIHSVWLDDNENIDLSYISKSIIDAYVDEGISLDVLENAERSQIIECVQDLDSYENLVEEMEELENE